MVERVLRMYEAPGSNPGSSICVFPSSTPFIFVTHVVTFPLPLFFFFNEVQWILFNITPFLLQGRWCHPTRAFTEGKKKEEKKNRNHTHRHFL